MVIQFTRGAYQFWRFHRITCDNTVRHVGLCILPDFCLCYLLRYLEASERMAFTPFQKGKKNKILTEVMLDLLCLSVPLLINTAFIVIRHRKLELFHIRFMWRYVLFHIS